MSIYEELEMQQVINANATLTRLGGSLMPPEVREAMMEASRYFVELDELQRRVGRKIAELTGNEAAYVSSGAAAGLTLATAACITRKDPEKIKQLPDVTGLKDEVIIHRVHRNGYDHAVRQVGVKVVEIGYSTGTARWELEKAITAQTAAIFWFQGTMSGVGDLPLPEVIAIAHEHGIPLIVDGAAQVPPVSNLWYFTVELGADLAIFSGGKDLRGPQPTGIVVGRQAIIEAMALNGNPNHSIGRPMKVGKEEMVGALAAVDRYLKLDHEGREKRHEEVVAAWNEALNKVAGVQAKRSFPNEAGQPLPRTLAVIDAAVAGSSRDELVDRLEAGNPIISVAKAGTDGIYINPMTLEPGEEKIVLDRLLEILTR